MTLKEAALLYAENDIAVFPLQPKSKKPIFNGGLHKATTDLKIIENWWTSHPEANIGIPMGEVNGIIGLDIDFKDGAAKDIVDRLAPTYMTLTPTGGLHAFYLKPKVYLKNGKKLEKGVTVRGDGYYFVAPPSIHPETLTAYKPVRENFPLYKAEFTECPEWIITHPGMTNGETRKENGNDKVPVGNRHDALKLYGCALRFDGMEEEEIFKKLTEYNNTKLDTPKAESEIRNLATWIMANVLPEPKEPVEIAEAFIMSTDKKMIFHKETFYDYTGTHYETKTDTDLQLGMHHWLHKAGGKLRKLIGKPKVNHIIRALNIPPIGLESSVKLPTWRKDMGDEQTKNLMPMANGIFDIVAYLEGQQNYIIPHSPDYLCTYCLPYEFDEMATCPNYDKIASDIFGNEILKQSWEEVMGYHLYQPMNLEKFFLIQGEGQNGKSVLSYILKGMLGERNCSNVGLQHLRPDCFLFYETFNKLANIVSDADDVDLISEGALKQFVSREEMSFERKFRDAFTAKPTALLTVISNQLPKFVDKSDGIWRRMYLLKIANKVKDAEIDYRFIDSDFWVKSGELSGILNKAIEGLRRLMKRGKLLEPKDMVEEKEQYRYELNPIKQFANEYVFYDRVEEEPTSAVYRAYVAMCRNNGNRSFAQHSFSRQFKLEALKLGSEIETTESKTQRRLCGPLLVWYETEPKRKKPMHSSCSRQREAKETLCEIKKMGDTTQCQKTNL